VPNTLDGKIKEAVGTIKEISQGGTHILVMFSGGKDSLTVALLCHEAGVKFENMYMESGLDLPSSVEKAAHYSDVLGIKLHKSHPVRDYQGDFSFQLRKFGYFPTIEHNWCMNRLKVRPCRAYCRKLWGMEQLYKLTGVRKSESTRRMTIYKANKKFQEDPEHPHATLGHIILDWTDSDVAEFLDKRGMLNSNDLYDKVGVSGCFWCPYYQDSIISRVERAYPQIHAELVRLEAELGKPALQGHRWLRTLIDDIHAQIPMELGI